MPMRSGGRAEPLRVTIARYGWPAERIAALDHCTFPWHGTEAEVTELKGVPLENAGHVGGRDALSVVGQYAAHLAFLQFAGVDDHEFAVADWAVVTRRGSDVRLVRLRPPRAISGETPALSLIEAMADAVHAPALRSTDRSWGRGESIYREVHERLRAERGDQTWLHSSAVGMIRSPGMAQLAELLEGKKVRLSYDDELAVASTSRACGIAHRALLHLGRTASPLAPLSAFSALGHEPKQARTAAATAEAISARIDASTVLLVSSWSRFDELSRAVLRILLAESGVSCVASTDCWRELNAGEHTLAGGSRAWILSTRLRAFSSISSQLESVDPDERFDWCLRFAKSRTYWDYLDHGATAALLSSADLVLQEPLKSFIGALAICGDSIDTAVAADYLRALGCQLSLEQLAVTGSIRIEDGQVRFTAPPGRLAEAIPRLSVSGLAEIALGVMLQHGRHSSAARLLGSIGEFERAADVAEKAGSIADSEVRALAASFPPSALHASPFLNRARVETLLESGGYLSAQQHAEKLPEPDRSYYLALIDRRLGHYGRALERLHSSGEPRALLLRAELKRLTGETAEARALLEETRFAEDLDRMRQRYELALIALEEGGEIILPEDDGYFGRRLASYAAVEEGRFEDATIFAREAAEIAPDLPSRIDAQLDSLYAEFLSGDWEGARQNARAILVDIDETEGDRAAGGVLFTLAYLCADAGFWKEAEEKIARLRRFYQSASDEIRLREVGLLDAHLFFSRGEWDAARAAAHDSLSSLGSEELREAARLIIDEVAWMAGDGAPLLSRGRSLCRELTDRWRAMRQRRGEGEAPESAFRQALLRFEAGDGGIPEANTGAERLQLFRSLQVTVRHGASPAAAAQLAALGARLGLATASAAPPAAETGELAMLQRLAAADFPFHDSVFGGRWLIARRNRLDRWVSIGTATVPSDERLVKYVAVPPDNWWTAPGDTLLHVERSRGWSDRTLAAVTSLMLMRLERHNEQRLREQEEHDEPPRTAAIDGIEGQSAAIRNVLAQIPKFAQRDEPVVLLGESGTGKELFAHAIHRLSPRRGRPFVAINCAALPEQLIESELFGHARGAFTGADRDHVGLIESADGGTLFLDEIGELPLSAQAKLLRFLQESEFRRVGDIVTRKADVRIVAATHRKLEQLVDQERFRADLYFRINVMDLAIPPLRERTGDILLLARHFLAAENAKHRGGPDRLSEVVEAILVAYDWPGNVRELQNTIRAAHAVAADTRTIDAEHLPMRLRKVKPSRASVGSYYEEVQRFRKSLIERSLTETSGNQNRAAKILGMTRQALAYQIRELGILVKGN